MKKKIKKIQKILTKDFGLKKKDAKKAMKKAKLKEQMMYSGRILGKLKTKEIAELVYNFD